MCGAEGTFDPVPDLADGHIDTLLPFRNFPSLSTLVHDAAFEFQLSYYLFIFSRVITLVGIDRCSLWKVSFLQRCFKMLDVAFVGRRCLLGQNETVLVCHRSQYAVYSQSEDFPSS